VVIRLWVIIDAAAYTTCRIDVMHSSLQDSCIEAANAQASAKGEQIGASSGPSTL
jgi:hypothetical protein